MMHIEKISLWICKILLTLLDFALYISRLCCWKHSDSQLLDLLGKLFFYQYEMPHFYPYNAFYLKFYSVSSVSKRVIESIMVYLWPIKSQREVFRYNMPPDESLQHCLLSILAKSWTWIRLKFCISLLIDRKYRVPKRCKEYTKRQSEKSRPKSRNSTKKDTIQ